MYSHKFDSWVLAVDRDAFLNSFLYYIADIHVETVIKYDYDIILTTNVNNGIL